MWKDYVYIFNCQEEDMPQQLRKDWNIYSNFDVEIFGEPNLLETYLLSNFLV